MQFVANLSPLAPNPAPLAQQVIPPSTVSVWPVI